jgi:hypothetical protein
MYVAHATLHIAVLPVARSASQRRLTMGLLWRLILKFQKIKVQPDTVASACADIGGRSIIKHGGSYGVRCAHCGVAPLPAVPCYDGSLSGRVSVTPHGLRCF